MNLQREWSTQPIVGSKPTFLAQLAELRLIDIGYINLIYENGSDAEICLCSGDQKIVAELISVGGDKAPIVNAMPGQYVLVFYTHTPVSLQTSTVEPNSMYDSRYAKALPIGIMGSNNVRIVPDTESLTVSTKNYRLTCGTSTIALNSDLMHILLDIVQGRTSFGLGGITINVASDGTAELLGNAQYDTSTGDLKTAGSITKIDGATGAIQISTGVDEQNSKIASTVDLKNDGSISVVSQDTDNSTSATISVATDGSISVSSKGDSKSVSISIASDGTMSITSDTLTLKADSGLTLDGDVTITGSLDVANGNFTVDK